MFKIYVSEGFTGSLPNGIFIGTDIEDAKEVAPSFKYDDWNEDWSSDSVYRLEGSLDSNKVISITIFIKKIVDDNLFEEYACQINKNIISTKNIAFVIK